MAIITTAQVKSFLGITGSDYDTAIDFHIPYVQKDYIQICNSGYELDEYIYINGITIAFNNLDPDTITDSNDGFVTAGFEAGHDILVEGSESNDGEYEIDTVAAGTLTLASIEELTTEAAGENVTITRLKWIQANLYYVAQMVWHRITSAQRADVRNESLSRYSVTYNQSSGGYPESVVNGLKGKNVRMS
jgi:hypothetical protein